MTSSLEKYAAGAHATVEGWLLQGAVDAIRELAACQRRFGIRGPVSEIGVHHGRLFILLSLLTEEGERSLAVDLFEMQEENVDGSGSGNREHFMRNLTVHGCDLRRVEVLTENSLRLLPSRIVEICGGRPRLFSIDGGHTPEITSHDLRLAHDALGPGGVVILDDFFNPFWPGVAEGACAFMRSDNTDLVPVAITSNKFFFAKGADPAAAYREGLRQAYPDAKTSRVFGHDVLSFEAPTSSERMRKKIRQTVATSTPWKLIRHTAAGAALRNGFRRWM